MVVYGIMCNQIIHNCVFKLFLFLERHLSLTHVLLVLRGLFGVLLLPVQDGRQQRRAETEINNGVLLPPLESQLVNENWLLGYSFIQGMGMTVHDEQNILMESHFNELDRRSGSLCTPT